ncbi:transient receptor potential cation channel subfamily V member 6-like [Protopterus annectens]|uniref:transient receptor potential cation channel subfamily V member 6-like n=1 Tax=Protopterus annectens TaxID=7888 RepID=UPI001CFC06BB|nr:transient receptor potential cation channel subfamily V member 6-like [Protopterus annectens]XP_043935648.1 transient receptor potential cation channel subfamily V member 6-like [Protopterus annectens]
MNTFSSGLQGVFRNLWKDVCFRVCSRKENMEVDHIHMLQQMRIAEIPLFEAIKENNIPAIKKLLQCSSTDPFQRGALGETALHIAAQYDNYEAAHTLLNAAPDLVNEPMLSEFYRGQTALHIAVVNKNVKLVKLFIQMGADVVTPQATGSFFRKFPGNLIYYGEHILSFAACAGDFEIVRLLIEKGANITARDYLGNTVFHILVLQSNKTLSCQMYDTIMEYDEKESGVPSDQIPNKEGLTPFKLTAKEGNIIMFQHLLQKLMHVQWTYGPLNSTLYNITEIDSCGEDLSILQLIVISENKEAHTIVDMTPVKELVGLKWHKYGKHYFRALGFIYLIYISIFTACCINRPLMPRPDNATDPTDLMMYVQKPLKDCYTTKADYVRLVGEIISLIGASTIMFIEILGILRFGVKTYFFLTVLGGPFHTIGICYSTLVLIILIIRLSSSDGEVVPMSMALILGWMYILYFARGFKMLGPYTIIIHKIIFADVLRFIWIMIFVIFGYTSAFQIIFESQNPSGIPAFYQFPMALQSTYDLFLNVLNVPTNYNMDLPNMYILVYSSFAMLTSVLMLNLLIAMMADTYFRVARQQELIWRIQVVAAMLQLEQRMPRWLWPRAGICGKEYGLGDQWYLRVEDKKNSPPSDNTNIVVPQTLMRNGAQNKFWNIVRHAIKKKAFKEQTNASDEVIYHL